VLIHYVWTLGNIGLEQVTDGSSRAHRLFKKAALFRTSLVSRARDRRDVHDRRDSHR
jgi:hypothetical protein